MDVLEAEIFMNYGAQPQCLVRLGVAVLWVILWGRHRQRDTLCYNQPQPATTRKPLSLERDAG